MNLPGILKNAVKTAHKITKSAHSPVTVYPWLSQDGAGDATYAAGESFIGVVDQKRSLRKLPDGKTITIEASILFTVPLPVRSIAGRKDPIDPKDKIVLQDGYSGPILNVNNSVVNPETGYGYTTEVWLG